MTAEVVVLNSSAVALAADSIATVFRSDGTSEKTHEVNKLFTLSKHAPVGVMVFGGAALVGVPWETVIKVYRKQLRDKTFFNVESYAADFFAWVGNARLISEADQKEWLLAVTRSFLNSIDNEIDQEVKSYVADEEEITATEVSRITDEVIDRRIQELESRGERAGFPDGFENTIRSLIADDIEQLIEQAIGQKPVSSSHKLALANIAVQLICRDVPFPDELTSGVVIAGFGESEMFPVVRCHYVSGVVGNQLIYQFDREASWEDGPGAAVIPYAQKDVAQTFLFGISQDDSSVISDYLTMIFNRLPTLISENLDADEHRIAEIDSQLRSATEDAVNDFQNRLFGWLKKRHVDPLLETLRFLPKEELAEIAESLVSLTSLKRKVSVGIETVGGPIDVAIISKGDGFIWTRRKHYFDPKLNPAFFQNYMGR